MDNYELLQKRVLDLEKKLNFVLTDKLLLDKDIKLNDGRDIIVAKGVGTKIGTESTQKIAFYGATPVVRQTAPTTPSSAGATYSQSQVQSVVDAVTSIETVLHNIGITT